MFWDGEEPFVAVEQMGDRVYPCSCECNDKSHACVTRSLISKYLTGTPAWSLISAPCS
uniref:Uncharacterized protein n=1 Tax=Oryza brachyantha TaxID=4533 RepID=J3KV89_ORYBR